MVEGFVIKRSSRSIVLDVGLAKTVGRAVGAVDGDVEGNLVGTPSGQLEFTTEHCLPVVGVKHVLVGDGVGDRNTDPGAVGGTLEDADDALGVGGVPGVADVANEEIEGAVTRDARAEGNYGNVVELGTQSGRVRVNIVVGNARTGIAGGGSGDRNGQLEEDGAKHEGEKREGFDDFFHDKFLSFHP